VHVVEIVELDDEELYVTDNVLEEASARYQMWHKKSKLRYRKELKKVCVSESDLNERETFTQW
jgi:hypothetical protein